MIFVHSKIDEFGLSTSAFRVYAHLARRATNRVAFPGIDSIAKVCRMSKNTVCEAIKELEVRNVITVERKPGVGSRYHITSPRTWVDIGEQPRTEASQNKERSPSITQNGTDHPKRGNATVPKEVTKGNPIKEIQKDNPTEVEFPEALNHPEFHKAWQEYLSHRRIYRFPVLKGKSIEETFAKLASYGLIGAIQSIKESISNGWRGLFPPKNANDRKPTPSSNGSMKKKYGF